MSKFLLVSAQFGSDNSDRTLVRLDMSYPTFIQYLGVSPVKMYLRGRLRPSNKQWFTFECRDGPEMLLDKLELLGYEVVGQSGEDRETILTWTLCAKYPTKQLLEMREEAEPFPEVLRTVDYSTPIL